MRIKSILAGTMVVSLAALGAGQTASAASQHVDNVSLQLQKQSRELMAEFTRHYRHAPQFAHLMSDSSRLYSQAVRIHAVAHNTHNLPRLNADLRQIDALYHHLEEVLDRIEHHTRYCRTPGCGHFHGDTRHVRGLLASIGDTIHHLKDDVRALSRRPAPGYHNAAGHYGVRRPVSVRPSRGYHGSSWNYRSGGHGRGVAVGHGGHSWHVRF